MGSNTQESPPTSVVSDITAQYGYSQKGEGEILSSGIETTRPAPGDDMAKSLVKEMS